MQEMKFKNKVKTELRKEVSKTFIIVSFGLDPSNQLNGTTGLTLAHVVTVGCRAEKPHSNQQLNSSVGSDQAL